MTYKRVFFLYYFSFGKNKYSIFFFKSLTFFVQKELLAYNETRWIILFSVAAFFKHLSSIYIQTIKWVWRLVSVIANTIQSYSYASMYQFLLYLCILLIMIYTFLYTKTMLGRNQSHTKIAHNYVYVNWLYYTCEIYMYNGCFLVSE